ncbi:MAG: hypothetical protein C4524_10310 [Candidatus Zixiibacteriota bacterium]|nr:MAG: hypothetical protein C4524_10310 [candidate division Zixibacteria bacterium]
MKLSRTVANFDSSLSMMRAVAAHLRGDDFANLGTAPAWTAPLLARTALLLNRLPEDWRQRIYTRAGQMETIPPDRLDRADTEAVNRWVARHYPRRRYPAVMIGSSDGAAVHLCTALGLPYLPQTYLVPVARSVDPNQPRLDLEMLREPARVFLQNNPQVRLHQMIDPVQDLLMSRILGYFRYKVLRLGPAWRAFLRESLDPGGTIILLEVGLTWPVTRVAGRHLFQFGGLGGVPPEEYLHGSPRVAQFLRDQGRELDHWEVPEPEGEAPEAEWGFDPELGEDAARFARKYGYRLRRLRVNRPVDLSPLVADLHREWYRRRGLPGNRLLVEPFVLQDPRGTLRAGAVPFWIPFSTEPFDRVVEDYLDRVEPFDEIGIMLFSHGVDSLGLVSAERWREVLRRARRRGIFVGSRPGAYPRDLAATFRYHTDLPRAFPSRYPLPGYLTLGQFESFLRVSERRYEVSWESEAEDREFSWDQAEVR